MGEREASPPQVTWTYPAALRRVVDGDTIDLTIDVGFRLKAEIRVRVWGIDTPEVRGPERELGLAATSWAVAWLTEAESLRVRTRKTGKYGRWLAEIWRDHDPVPLHDALVRSGHARYVDW